MSEFSDILKVIIDKGGFKTFLFSVAVAIISQKLWLNDWLWSVVVFCGCFLLVSFIVWIYEKISKYYESKAYERRKALEAKAMRDAQYNRRSIIYKSLPQMTQQTLVELYKLPQQDLPNVRILNNLRYQSNILQVCRNVQLKHNIINVEENYGSYIIHIEDVFCEVLAEHISDFN